MTAAPVIVAGQQVLLLQFATVTPLNMASQNASPTCSSTTLRRQRPRLSMNARERTRQLLSGGSTCSEVVIALRQEGIDTCRQTVWRLERHIRAHGTINPLPKSGRPTKLTDVALQNIDTAMMQDDETTDKRLVTSLRGAGVSVSAQQLPL